MMNRLSLGKVRPSIRDGARFFSLRAAHLDNFIRERATPIPGEAARRQERAKGMGQDTDRGKTVPTQKGGYGFELFSFYGP